MISLAELCAEMERSERYLTPRAARDWWTKGLLPRPRRHGLGRQKGTETFWVEPHIVEQAKAAHDLLAIHSRTFTALIGLWLSGFPIELKLVRCGWMELIARNQPHREARSGTMPLDEAVGRLAANVGSALLRPDAPTDIRSNATDFLNELLSAFYGVDDEPATLGLAELLAATVPYWSNEVSQPMPFDDTHIEWLITHIRDWFSLPTQREILRSATDHEFVRARRFVHVALGVFGRAARQLPIDQRDALREHGRKAVIIFGRTLLLPLIAILRGPSTSKHIPTLLRLSRGIKQKLGPA